MANPYLHNLMPLFKRLYRKGSGALWYYDENANFDLATHSRRGVRQWCLTMELVDTRLREAMGEQGTLYAYCDDSYLFAEPGRIAEVLSKAPAIYPKFGLKIGYGLGKTKLILPRGYERKKFPYSRDDPVASAPHVVPGL
jgi:hypothetical protein